MVRIKILERDVKRAILDYCEIRNIFVESRNVGAVKTGNRFIRYNRPGMADLWGIGRNGRHWECELKAPGKEPTDQQRAWLAQCAMEGAYCFWCDSLDGFIEHIKNLQEPR